MRKSTNSNTVATGNNHQSGGPRGGRGGAGKGHTGHHGNENYRGGNKKWGPPAKQGVHHQTTQNQTKGPPADDAVGGRQHLRVLFILKNFIGNRVEIETENHLVYEGVYPFHNVHSLGVTLKCAHQIIDGKKSPTMKFVTVSALDIGRVSGPGTEIMLTHLPKLPIPMGEKEVLPDTAISGHTGNVRERPLQKWANDSSASNALSLDEHKGRNNAGQWDQFATNAKLFGVTSDFDEHLYTTVVDKSDPDFKRREQEAIRLAREIERGPVTNSHIAEERNIQVAANANLDEEDRYSSVIRGPGKYVPPGARKNSGPSPTQKPTNQADTNANQQPLRAAYAAAAAGHGKQAAKKPLSPQTHATPAVVSVPSVATTNNAQQHPAKAQQAAKGKDVNNPGQAKAPTPTPAPPAAATAATATATTTAAAPVKASVPVTVSAPAPAATLEQRQASTQKKPAALSATAIARLAQKTGQAKIAGGQRADQKIVDPNYTAAEVARAFNEFTTNERATHAKKREDIRNVVQSFKEWGQTFKLPMPMPDDMKEILRERESPKATPGKIKAEKPASAAPVTHTGSDKTTTAPGPGKPEAAASSSVKVKADPKAPSPVSDSGKTTTAAADDVSDKGSVATAATAPVKKSTFKFNADAAEFTPTFAMAGSSNQSARDGNSSGDRSPYTNSNKRIGPKNAGPYNGGNKGYKYPKNQLSPKQHPYMPTYHDDMYQPHHPQGIDPNAYYAYNMPAPYGYGPQQHRPNMRPFVPPMSMPPGAFMHPAAHQFNPAFAPPHMYPQFAPPPPPHMHPHHPHFAATQPPPFVNVTQGIASPVQPAPFMRSPNQMFANPQMFPIPPPPPPHDMMFAQAHMMPPPPHPHPHHGWNEHHQQRGQQHVQHSQPTHVQGQPLAEDANAAQESATVQATAGDADASGADPTPPPGAEQADTGTPVTGA